MVEHLLHDTADGEYQELFRKQLWVFMYWLTEYLAVHSVVMVDLKILDSVSSLMEMEESFFAM